MVVVKMKPGTEGPLSRSERESSVYLRVSLADGGRRFKRALAREVPSRLGTTSPSAVESRSSSRLRA